MNRGFMLVTVPRDETKTPAWTEVEPTGKQFQPWKPVPASQSKFIPKSDFNEPRTDEKNFKKTKLPPITNGKVFPTEEDKIKINEFANARPLLRDRRSTHL